MVTREYPNSSHHLTIRWSAKNFSSCHKSTILCPVKVDLDPEFIGSRLYEWLGTELTVTFNEGFNHELDNYEKTRLSYLRPTAENPNKVRPHYERYGRLMGRVATTPNPYADDALVATIAHHTAMQVGGAFRLDTNLRAKSQPLYNFLHAGLGFQEIGIADRAMQPVCVSLSDAAETGLIVAEGFEAGHEVDQLRRYAEATNEFIYKKFTHTQALMVEARAEVGKAFPRDHKAIHNMHSVQKNAVSLIAAHFAVAAWSRGGPEYVPILQPDALHLVENLPHVMILAEDPPQYE